MKICIDVQSVISKPTGVGRYTIELVKALAELKNREDIVLSYFNFLGNYNGVKYFPNREIKIIPGRVYSYLWKKIGFPPFNWLAGKYDVYHFPNFCLPPMGQGLDKHCVVTVHDTAFMRYPEYIEPKNLKFLQQELPKSLNRAGKIIAVSHFVKKEIEELFNIAPEKIEVIYEGIDGSFKRCEKRNLDLPESYILYVGTLEPRKNIEGLLKAFKEARLKGFKLVIVGGKGWFYEGIFELVEQLGLKNEVIFPGYVPDGDLPEVYSRAKAFVFPSFYEGFGLPPLEAMACGVPVVSTKFEVLGEAARFVNPENIDSIADGINDVLVNSTFYSQKGLEQAKKYTWKKTAEETMKLYKKT